MANFYAKYPATTVSIPAGGATAANQVLEIAQLTAINSNTSGSATAANQVLEINQLTAINSNTSDVATETTLSAISSQLAGTIDVDTGLLQGLTDTQLRATPVPVSGTVSTGGLTDAQLRATPVPVSGTVTANAGTGTFAVSAASLPLPSGAATAANQATEIASLSSIDSKLTSPLTVTGPLTDTQLRATPVPVSGTITSSNASIGSNGAAIPTSSTLVGGSDGTNLQPLSTTAAGILNVISANIQTNSAALPSKTALVGGTDGTLIKPIKVDTAGVVATSATQSGSWTVLPGNTANTTAWLVTQNGRSQANAPVRNDYSSVNVTTGAYVQLVASTTSITNVLEIFDSSGQTLYLATGAAASEVNQLIIYPGGNGRVEFKIAAGTRVSIKAISATANTGEIDVNFYT